MLFRLRSRISFRIMSLCCQKSIYGSASAPPPPQKRAKSKEKRYSKDTGGAPEKHAVCAGDMHVIRFSGKSRQHLSCNQPASDSPPGKRGTAPCPPCDSMLAVGKLALLYCWMRYVLARTPSRCLCNRAPSRSCIYIRVCFTMTTRTEHLYCA